MTGNGTFVFETETKRNQKQIMKLKPNDFFVETETKRGLFLHGARGILGKPQRLRVSAPALFLPPSLRKSSCYLSREYILCTRHAQNMLKRGIGEKG